MKERINRLAKGIIDSDLPKMIWTPDVIEDTVRVGTTVKREIFIGFGRIQESRTENCERYD